MPEAAAGGVCDDDEVVEANRDDDIVMLLIAGRDREAAQRGAALTRAGLANERDGGRMDALAQFDQLGGVLGGVIVGLQPDDLDRPTPCAEFSVRGVLEHMITGATTFAAAYRGERPPEPDVADPIAGVQSALRDLGAAISVPGALDRTIQAPFGELDGESFARFVVLDGLVHGWDLATATGQPYDPPAELVTAVNEFAEHSLDPLRDGQTFMVAVEPSPDATAIERLANYTGRAVVIAKVRRPDF